jgi:phosphoribosyl 1,2-cyclic phosphodiesterase
MLAMKVISLQSGSNGNCFYVEASGVRLLFDAGISGRCADERLQTHGRDIRNCEALFISHDHSDHIRSMGVFQRKFGLPVYVTRGTLNAAYRTGKVGAMQRVRFFSAGDSVEFAAEDGSTVLVHTVPTPHDSADGVAFVIEDGHGNRVGILTDLGHVFDGLREVLESLDAVIIESNYDDEMLEYGRYPAHLKQRIRGRGGHISNEESANLIQQVGLKRLKWACLCHLSQDNNRPDVAVRTHKEILGNDFPVYVASRDEVSRVFEI